MTSLEFFLQRKLQRSVPLHRGPNTPRLSASTPSSPARQQQQVHLSIFSSQTHCLLRAVNSLRQKPGSRALRHAGRAAAADAGNNKLYGVF